MKKHSKKLMGLSLIFVLLFSLVACGGDGASSAVTEGIFKAGTYTAVTDGHNGKVEVTVTFDENLIKDVRVTKHEESPGISDPATQGIPEAILATQSTFVDTVTGATVSSTAIIDAVKECIKQAGADPETLSPVETDGGSGETIKKETDVIVVGGGLAGLSAAVKAAENGANVILIEKTAALGGSSALSGGGIGATGSEVQYANGIDDTDAAWRELWETRQATSPSPNPSYPDWERVDDLIAHSKDSIAWLSELGYGFGIPEGFGVDPVKRLHFPAQGTGGSFLTSFLGEKADELGVDIMLDTVGETLIQNDAGEITGIIAGSKTGPVELSGKAVILASGGFANSPELVERFTPEVKDFVPYSVSAAGNTGDGILMAEEVGAVPYEEAWHIGLGLKSTVKDFNGIYWYGTFVLLNKEGKRFTNEGNHYSIVYNDAAYQSNEGSFMMIDSSAMFADFLPVLDAAIDDKEVFKAATLTELAAKTGMSSETLSATMERYNSIATGVADEFGKAEKQAIPLSEGPFYAVRFYPSSMGTFGGVKTTADTFAVLDKDNTKIPGLFAAGEMANKPFYNQVYMSGSALLVATTSGQRAGEAAAKLAVGENGGTSADTSLTEESEEESSSAA